MARAADKRPTRGRLSSIELMIAEHPHTQPDVNWANEELRDRKLTQEAILEELNQRIIAKGVEPITKSSFSRHAVRKAIAWSEIDAVNRIAKEVVGDIDPEAPEQVTILVAEQLKVLCYALLERGDIGTKGALELARTLQSAVSSERGSDEYRKQLERRVAAQLEKAAGKIEDMGRAAGLSAERAAELRREVLGVSG